jgi:fermentation-respiration switch protein FrsA (DUF1100 family)
MIIKIFTGLFTFYFLYAALFYLLQRKLIYPLSFIPESFVSTDSNKFEKHFISLDESSVEAFFFPAKNSDLQKQPLMIIAHGNASLIDYWIELLDKPLEMGINVLLVEYPGYGRSDGTPTQQSITDIFIKAYDLFAQDKRVDAQRIIYLGRSLGGGVVCSLAKQRPPAAMILSSTFTSVRSFARQYFLPGFLASDPYDNLDFIKTYNGPLMLVHGTQDRTIPFSHSQKLLESSPDAFFVSYQSDHNNTPPDWNDFWDKVHTFLLQHGLTNKVENE